MKTEQSREVWKKASRSARSRRSDPKTFVPSVFTSGTLSLSATLPCSTSQSNANYVAVTASGCEFAMSPTSIRSQRGRKSLSERTCVQCNLC
ncbi:hypothetical protein SAMN05192539_103625 [Paraburkholderia diazotrophica]|uniref:Uncharacterized protein n=1 Tax=Paraburkholderia diazotrophica TaxID=667676 RepID=A0A1H7E396_9BURK|nr:hypothetical protein SAMN05192539_103625 [Paraburkholderia diazotrophica]